MFNTLLIFGFIFNLFVSSLIAQQASKREIGATTSLLIGICFGFLVQFLVVSLSPTKKIKNIQNDISDYKTNYTKINVYKMKYLPFIFLSSIIIYFIYTIIY